ncbi:ribonuclease HII [Vibrio cholerae]|nr:ribonuclease HII [Vibrio cholerae]
MVLIDGNKIPKLPMEAQAVVKGDLKSSMPKG